MFDLFTSTENELAHSIMKHSTASLECDQL